MTVERTEDYSGPSLLTIFFAPSSTSTQSPAPTKSTDPSKPPSDHIPADRTQVIDMKYKEPSEVLEEVMAVTQGRQVEPSEQERQEMLEIEQQKERSYQDRVTQLTYLKKVRREQAILEQAKKSVVT